MSERHGDATPYSEDERQRDAQAQREALERRYTARQRKRTRIYRERPHGAPLSQVYHGHSEEAIQASHALAERKTGG